MAGISSLLPNVLILENKSRAGRKFLVSGKGQCNLTNNTELNNFFPHYGENGKFLRPALYNFSNRDLIDFFKKNGCQLNIREDGKVFPESRDAKRLLNVLLQELAKKKRAIIFNAEVTDISRENDIFHCKTARGFFRGKNIIIATGGKSYPATGSKGQGYQLAQKLGHNIIVPRPSLSPLFSENDNFILQDLTGISFHKATLNLYRNSKKIRSRTEPLLLTHQGLSGPAALHLSRYLEQGDSLTIDFLPGLTTEGLEKNLLNRETKKNLLSTLTGQLPRRFVKKILQLADITADQSLTQLDKERRKKLLKLIKEFPIVSIRSGSYNEAMATAGGITLNEVNPKTMESRICPGLYFAGEVLDIDGDTGGYNLQAAFSTGYLAGTKACR